MYKFFFKRMSKLDFIAPLPSCVPSEIDTYSVNGCTFLATVFLLKQPPTDLRVPLFTFIHIALLLTKEPVLQQTSTAISL